MLSGTNYDYRRVKLNDGRCGLILDESEQFMSVRIDPYFSKNLPVGEDDVVSIATSSVAKIFPCQSKSGCSASIEEKKPFSIGNLFKKLSPL